MARDKMFTIRVDEAEHALFKGAAAAVPVSISEYARDAMLARMALEQTPSGPSERVVAARAAIVEVLPLVINKPADVPSAVERVVERNAASVSHQARAFTPYSKEQQTGKAQKKTKAEPVQSCRHGLLRCKVCGTG